MKELSDASIPVALNEALVSDHDVVVFTEGARDELLKWDNFCRSRTAVVSVRKGETEVAPKPVKFIAAGVKGAAGYLFSDFGPAFMCHDENGEVPVVRHIRSISNAVDVRDRDCVYWPSVNVWLVTAGGTVYVFCVYMHVIARVFFTGCCDASERVGRRCVASRLARVRPRWLCDV